MHDSLLSTVRAHWAEQRWSPESLAAFRMEDDGGDGGDGAGDGGDGGSQPRSLTELLSGLSEEDRAIVLGEVDKGRKDAGKYRQRVKELEPLAKKAKDLEDAQKTAEEKASEREKAAEDREAKASARAVVAEVKGLAADKFADPNDAALFLDVASYVDTSGEIDSDAIERDLDALLAKKPHLAKGDGREPLRPDRSQGARGGDGGKDPGSLLQQHIQRQLTT